MPVLGSSQHSRGAVAVGDLFLTHGVGAATEAVIRVPKVAKVPIDALTTGEKDTGFDLPATGIVLDVWVHVRTAESTGTTKTIDVGLLSSETGGDTDGFLDGVSTATAGVVAGTFTYTDGTNQNYISAATMGVLLYDGLLGGDAAGTAGTAIRTPHVLNGTAKSLVYQLGSAHTELVGDIYVSYLDFTND